MPAPGSNGTVRCDISVQRGESFAVGNPEDSRNGQMEMEWFWGFPGISYDPTNGLGGNGGSCTYSGPRPPSMGGSVSSASLFVSSINDGTIANEPVGKTKVAVSSFGGDSATLTFSGSQATSYSDDNEQVNAQFDWGITATFTRR
jgi:hypothetical protein